MSFSMTSRERVITALNRRQPDRVPATLYEEVIGYVPEVDRALKERCGGASPGDYFQCDVRSVAIRPTKLRRDFPNCYANTPGVRTDEWGIGWQAGGFHHYEQILHPLERLLANEIRDYTFPDFDADYRYAGLREEVAQIHDRGLAVTGYPGSVFERAWALRGMPELFNDIATDPDTAAFLLDGIAGCVRHGAQRLAAADIDVLILGDDIATQRGLLMSPAMWKSVFKPRLKAIIQAAKDVKPDLLIFYHSDGNVWDLIPELIDAGVEVLNPVQPDCINPAEAKKAFGDRLAFFGTISVQRTMPFGTPADVENEVRERIATVGQGGGLLLAPAHVLQPGTPWENVCALFRAVHQGG